MSTPTITDQSVSDTYIYLLSRLLVLRQQQLDFQEGFKWNVLVHRKPGSVAESEPRRCIFRSLGRDRREELPDCVGAVHYWRYYTVQFLNGWGETVANINERVFPKHPSANSPFV